MALDVAVEHLDGTVVVLPLGELDLATAPDLERVLDGLVGEHPSVLVDLRGVTFADCAGLRPIRKALQQGTYSLSRVRLAGARGRVQRVVDLTGLERAFAAAGAPGN